MRVALPVDNHPQRDEIVRKLFDTKHSILSISQEYGINRHTLSKARKRLHSSAGEIVAATLPIAPEVAAKTTDSQLSIPALADDLQHLKSKLRTLQTSGALKPSQLMQAVDGERRVIETLLRMAEMVAQHQDGKNTPAYQQLLKAIADTLKSHPELRDEFKRNFEKYNPIDDNPPAGSEDGVGGEA